MRKLGQITLLMPSRSSGPTMKIDTRRNTKAVGAIIRTRTVSLLCWPVCMRLSDFCSFIAHQGYGGGDTGYYNRDVDNQSGRQAQEYDNSEFTRQME